MASRRSRARRRSTQRSVPAERIEVTVTARRRERGLHDRQSSREFPSIDVRVASPDAWDGYLFLGDVPNGGAGPTSQIFILDVPACPYGSGSSRDRRSTSR
jgi:hypothetical protein